MKRTDVSGFIRREDHFSSREPGLTHPDTSAFVRLRDNGDVEIVAGEGLGIFFNAQTRSCTIMADTVKVLTREDGFRWNRVSFNDKAVTFDEPTFLSADYSSSNNTSMYGGVEKFFKPSVDQSPLDVVVDGEKVALSDYAKRVGTDAEA